VKAARTRALRRRSAGAAKTARTARAAKKAAPAKAARKAPARRTAAQVRLAHLRAVSLGDVQCCSADALAWSLRLAGWPCSGADVLALYKLTADSPGAAASIVATLEAAYAAGLAGVRPASFGPASLDDPAAVILGLDMPEAPHAVALDPSGAVWSWGALYDLTGEAVVEEAWAVCWPSRWPGGIVPPVTTGAVAP
jgi:hypothetical protein